LRSSSGPNFLDKSEQIYDSIEYHGAYEEQKKEGEIIEKRITHVTASFFLSQDGEVHFDANQSDCFRFASGDITLLEWSRYIYDITPVLRRPSQVCDLW
jgi:hypothetical protein